jgi:hypothetical protein
MAGTERRPLELEVAVRGRGVPPNRRQRRARRFQKALGRSKSSLVFDAETTTGLGQRLRVGWYQRYRGARLQESGLFGDRDALDPEELALVEAYAVERGLPWLTREEFVGQVFLRYAGKRRRALIVGANLPFDISQVAISHGPAKDRTGFMRGGFSFGLHRSPYYPHVQAKRLGARATSIRLTVPEGRSAEARNNERGGDIPPHRGYFLDVLGVGPALFGQKLTLKALAERLGTEHRKLDSPEHGERITREYLEYLERDVLVSWECAQALQERYQRLGFSETPITDIYSEASIGKALLKETGATPWLDLQQDLPEWLLASILETYYGGRTECRIRRLAVPGVYLDFLSQYPTVFVLQQLHRYLFAQGFDWHDEDPAELQHLLERIQPEDVLDPTLWPTLDALCLVQPDGDLLPTRARFRRSGTGAYNLALAYRHGGPAQWWTLADVISSVLETGRITKLLRVLRFSPRARQTGLQPVDLNGDPGFRVDPAHEDLIKRLVELRQQLKTDADAAEDAGETERAALLEGLSLGLKIEANAIAYGTPIEMNITEHLRPKDLTLTLSDDTQYPCRNRRVESPGRWFNPLIATLVSSGGRLLLATAISLLHRRLEGEYALCDTDSLFAVATKNGGLIPCPGGPHRLPDGQEAILALSHEQVRENLIEPFRQLNPYNGQLGERSILELEDENLHPESREQIEISCLSLAAKRYGLFNLDEDGQPRLVGKPGSRRRSEHGLGHLILPHHLDQPGVAIDEFWTHLIATELGLDRPEPDYFGQPAIGRLTVTSQSDQNAFKTYNQDKPYPDQIRPWHFLSIAHPDPLERARLGIRCLIGPYRRDLDELAAQEWIDRGNPDRSYRLRLDNPYEISDDTIAAQTIRDYFDSYRHHSDPKMLGPDGDRCHPWTRGLLQPHHVTATSLLRIGKESNPLLDPNDPTPQEPTIEYRPLLCMGCGRPLRGQQRKWHSDACRKRTARRGQR